MPTTVARHYPQVSMTDERTHGTWLIFACCAASTHCTTRTIFNFTLFYSTQLNSCLYSCYRRQIMLYLTTYYCPFVCPFNIACITPILLAIAFNVQLRHSSMLPARICPKFVHPPSVTARSSTAALNAFKNSVGRVLAVLCTCSLDYRKRNATPCHAGKINNVYYNPYYFTRFSFIFYFTIFFCVCAFASRSGLKVSRQSQL